MATFAKHDGQWLVRSTEDLRPGSQVAITKRDGSVSTVTISSLLCQDGDSRLYTFQNEPRQTGQTRQTQSTSRRVCAECGRGGRLVRDLEDGMLKHHGCCDIPP